jgi:hypothetical protein
MKRRAFVAAATAAAAAFVPQAWSSEEVRLFGNPERISLFGHQLTQFLWPKDRPIIMRRDPASISFVLSRRGGVPEQVCEGNEVMVPVLDLRECPLDSEAVESFVKACLSGPRPDSFLYLFRIKGYVTLYALLGSQTPMSPVTDHFASSLRRFENRLRKKGKIG